MKRFLYFLILGLMPLPAFTQMEKKEEHVTPKRTTCSESSAFIPYEPDYMPIKRIRLAIHIFVRPDSTQSLLDIPDHHAFLTSIDNHLKWMYMAPEALHPYPEGKKYVHIKDTRLRFLFDTVLFHYDDSAWDFRSKTVKFNGKDTFYNEWAAFGAAEDLYKKFVEDNDELPTRIKDSALNIFFVEPIGYGNRGMAHSIGSAKWLYAAGIWEMFSKGRNHWHPAMLLAHEIGHALGLTHPFEYSSCEDLPRTPKGSTSNIMDQQPGQGSALTACQIGRMHWALSGNLGDISKVWVRDWCTYHPDSAVRVKAGDTVVFSSLRALPGDLILENGAVLVVKCDIYMPPSSGIYIEDNATLIIDGGTVKNDCRKQWKGIKLQKRPGFLIFKRRPTAALQLINGGQVLNTEKEQEIVAF